MPTASPPLPAPPPASLGARAGRGARLVAALERHDWQYHLRAHTHTHTHTHTRYARKRTRTRTRTRARARAQTLTHTRTQPASAAPRGRVTHGRTAHQTGSKGGPAGLPEEVVAPEAEVRVPHLHSDKETVSGVPHLHSDS